MAAQSSKQRLPGMEDAKIEELNALAEEYVKYRDKRQQLLNKEVEKKGELLTAMKKHKKQKYKFDDIEIEIVHEEETIKVRKLKADPDGEEE